MLNKNFKKTIVYILCATICIFGLSACNTSSSEQTQTAPSQTEENIPSTITPIENMIAYDLPNTAEESNIFVEPIPDLSSSFIRGMDTSTVLAEEKSGVIYYNESGEDITVNITCIENVSEIVNSDITDKDITISNNSAQL